jgi:hypothetical protein
MSRHNRDHAEVSKDASRTKAEVNTTKQGDTANIKQNTTMPDFSREGG